MSRRRPRTALLLAVSLLGAASLASAGGARPTAAGTCAHWVAPGGNDAGAGSRSDPYGTVAKLLSSLRPGQAGCLLPGVTIDEHVVIGVSGATGKPITLESTPNAQGAVLDGGIEFAASSHDVILRHLAIRAPGTPGSPLAIVVLRGFRNEVLDSDIDGSATPDRSQACILLDHANRALIDHNAIRECSKVVSNPQVYVAGIFDQISTRAVITNNVIDGQYGDAIALSPRAELTSVSRNQMQHDGSGVYFGGDAKATSDDNTVTRNVIGPTTGYSIHASFPSGAMLPKHNLVSNNCFWQPGKGYIGAATPANAGFTTRDNRSAPVTSPKCSAYRPAPAGVRGAAAPTAAKKPSKAHAAKALSPGLMLIAGGQQTGTTVRVARAYLTGTRNGAAVVLRCTRGCSLVAREAAKGSRVLVGALTNATLHVGDVVEVRVTEAGYLGAFASFVVNDALKHSIATGVFQRTSSGCLNGTARAACPK